MKTNFKVLSAAMLMLVATGVAQARPIVLPDLASSKSESGQFTVNSDNSITLNGTPISLNTTPAIGTADIENGMARFNAGSLTYSDGKSSISGKLSKVTLGKQEKDGQVIYVLKGLVYGTLSKGGSTVDVNGSLGVTTKPAMDGTVLSQAQVDSSHLVVTTRSNINNTLPPADHNAEIIRRKQHAR